MTVRVVSLGDSTSCGEGVGLRLPLDRTWPARLTGAVPGGELVPLATAGARVSDVRRRQLPAAIAAAPHLATLLVGLNDVSRGGFCRRSFAADLQAVVDGLLDTGATVLLGRLHDPVRLLPLPAALRAAVRDRVDAVNGAVDVAARRPDVHVLDLAAVPALRQRAAWDVDRLHPAAAGHAHLADAAATVLRVAGLPVGVPARAPEVLAAPGARQEAWWLVRHGCPWLAGHVREVVAPALALALP